MKAPGEEIYTTNRRKEHNAEKYIQWLQRYRLQYASIFIRLAVASQMCEIPRNSLKIRTYNYAVQGHPRSSMLMSIESAYATSYSHSNFRCRPRSTAIARGPSGQIFL